MVKCRIYFCENCLAKFQKQDDSQQKVTYREKISSNVIIKKTFNSIFLIKKSRLITGI